MNPAWIASVLPLGLLLAPPAQEQQAGTRPTSRPSTSSAPATVTARIGELSARVPRDWKSVQPTSRMRKAEWVLPGAGAGKDASLVVFHFGQSAGDLESNLERWKGQIEQDPPDNATVRRSKGIATLDIRGTYVAETMPGSGERQRVAGQRMLASVVETKAGAHYFKLVGPLETIERWKSAFEDMLASIDG